MSALDLRLFGSIHVDRVPKVTAELESYAVGDADAESVGDGDADAGPGTAPGDADHGDDPVPAEPADSGDPPPVDALFVEFPDLVGRIGPAAGDASFAPRDALRLYFAALVRTPAFLLGQLLVVAVTGPLYVACNRSLLPAEFRAVATVSDRHDLPVHAVDRHPVQSMADAGPGWLLANWAVLAALVATVPRALAVAAATLVGATLVLYGLFYAARRAFLVLGIPACLGALAVLLRHAVVPAFGFGVVLVASVAVLHRGRNRHMVDRAAALAAEHGYRRGCLLTGKAHLDGVVAAAADRDDVRVTRVLTSKCLRRTTDVTAYSGDAAGSTATADAAGDAGLAADAGATTDVRSTRAGDPAADAGATPAVEPAPGKPSRRVGAAVVDLVVLAPLAGVGAVVCGVAAGLALGEVTTASVVAGALLTPPLYHVVTETLWGRGVGKLAFGLAVVAADGSPASASDAVVRTLLRPVDLLLCGLPMFLSRRSQRLGDRLAGTVVVAVGT